MDEIDTVFPKFRTIGARVECFTGRKPWGAAWQLPMSQMATCLVLPSAVVNAGKAYNSGEGGRKHGAGWDDGLLQKHPFRERGKHEK